MSLLGVSQFASVPLEPRVPLSAQIVGRQLPVQDVVLARKSIELAPIGKSTGLGALEQIDIRVSSANDYLVPSSMVLEFDLFNTSTDSGGATPSISAGFDDIPGVAVFDRADVYVGGQLLERLEDVGSKTTAEILAHASKDYYSFVAGNLMGAWKFNDQQPYDLNVALGTAVPTLSDGDTTGNTGATIKNFLDATNLAVRSRFQYTTGVQARQKLITAGASQSAVSYVAGSTAGRPSISAGRQYTTTQGAMRIQVPLALVCGFCQSNELFPLSFVSELRMLFTLALANKSMYSPTASDILSYRIDNVRVHYDAVEMSQDYIRATASILASGDESMGYHKPIQTYTTRKISVGALTSGVETRNDGIATIATPFLNSLLIWSRPSAISTTQYNTSSMPATFVDYGLSRTNASIQVQIGSQRFPYSQPIDNAVELYRHNIKEMGELADVKGSPSVNTFATLVEQNTAGGISFLFQSFSSVVGTESQAEPLEMEAFDTNAFAGQIQYSQVYNAGSTESYETNVLGKHTKVFSLTNGVAKIMG
jgi:hypothetical protein